MKRIFAGAMALTMSLGPAHAGERENALRHIAQAIAVEKMCTKLATNSGLLILMAVRFGIDFERDQAELLKVAAEAMEPYRDKAEDVACIAGALLYGPNGQNVPDLVKWK